MSVLQQVALCQHGCNNLTEQQLTQQHDRQEGNKRLVVAGAHTVAKDGAVVVKPLHTPPADRQERQTVHGDQGVVGERSGVNTLDILPHGLCTTAQVHAHIHIHAPEKKAPRKQPQQSWTNANSTHTHSLAQGAVLGAHVALHSTGPAVVHRQPTPRRLLLLLLGAATSSSTTTTATGTASLLLLLFDGGGGSMAQKRCLL